MDLLKVKKKAMKSKLIIVSLFFIYLYIPAIFASENKITAITINTPPYSYNEKGRQKGIATEIVKEMFKELKLNIRIYEHPLRRAYIEALKGNVLIYPVLRNPINENDFHWIGKISKETLYFYRYKKRSAEKILSIEDLKRKSIGIVRGSVAYERLSSLGFNNMEEVSKEIQNLKKAARSRIDFFVSDELVLLHIIEIHNKEVPISKRISMEDFVKVMPIPNTKSQNGLYIALSKKTPKSTVTQFKLLFRKVEEQGKLIEVAHWWTNRLEQRFVDILKNNLARKGYKWVDYTFEGGAGSNMKRLLKIRDKSTRLPDAIQTYMGPALWHWAKKGALINLNQVALAENWEKVLPEMIKKMIKYKENYVAAPINIQRVNWLWINPVVFKKSNAKIPRNWSELVESSKKIKAAGFIPLSIGFEPWQEGTLFENMVLGIGGADFYKKAFMDLDEKTLSSERMTEILKIFKSLKKFTKTDQHDRSWTSAAHLVASEKAAMYVMGDWVKEIFKSEGLTYPEGYICMPVPGTEGIFLNNTDVFAFPKSGEINIPGQRALAGVIMNSKVQKRFNLYKGSIPSRLDISMDGFDPVAKISMQSVLKDKMIPSFNFRQTAPEEIHEGMVKTISRIFESDTTPEEAADEFARIIKRHQQQVKAHSIDSTKP